VLTRGPLTDALLAALRELNREVEVVDRGAYLRVLVPGRCRLTRQAVERRLGEPFTLPADLEEVMPSFVGRLSITAEEAIWS
jgi:toluene monooxygenase system protein D